jgi:hypothetical protein
MQICSDLQHTNRLQEVRQNVETSAEKLKQELDQKLETAEKNREKALQEKLESLKKHVSESDCGIVRLLCDLKPKS